MFCRASAYPWFVFLNYADCVDLWYLKTLKVLLVSCRTDIMHYVTLSCFVQLLLLFLCSHSFLHNAELRVSTLNALSILNRALCKHFKYAHRAREASLVFLGFFAPILSEHFLCIQPISCVTLHFPCQICVYFIVRFTFFYIFLFFFLSVVTGNMQQKSSLYKNSGFNAAANLWLCLKSYFGVKPS